MLFLGLAISAGAVGWGFFFRGNGRTVQEVVMGVPYNGYSSAGDSMTFIGLALLSAAPFLLLIALLSLFC